MKFTAHKWQSILRDVFLGSIALAILFDQVFLVAHAQPILIFLVIFLFGSIPALRGDSKGGRPSTFARVIMTLLGISFPESYEDNEEGNRPSDSTDGPKHSSSSTPKHSPGPPPAGSSRSSSKSAL